MARGRRKQAAVSVADQPVSVEDVEQSGGEEAAEGDVAEAELETIASRVTRFRAKGLDHQKILLYDGDLIAFAGGSTDPEVQYNLAEVQGIVPVENESEQGPNGTTIRVCFYFNEEISPRGGCLWMPLGMSSGAVYSKRQTWTRVKATTGLKGDRIRVSWSEHRRIQAELGVASQFNPDSGDENEEEEEQEEEDEDDDGSGDDQVATQVATSQQKVPGKTKRASASHNDSGSDDEAPPAKKSRGARGKSSSSPGKAPRQPRPPKEPKAVKFKKGFAAPRPNVQLIDSNPAFTGDSPVKGGSSLHSLDVLRAVYRKDLVLLQQAFDDTENVGWLLSGHSVSDSRTAMDVAVERGDFDILSKFMEYYTSPGKPKARPLAVNSSLQQVGSGSVGIATFGHGVGPIGAARGGRELQNALLHSVILRNQIPSLQEKVLQCCRDIPSFERMQVVLNMAAGQSTMLHMVTAVRCGNRDLAQHLAKKMLTLGGWELNKLHVEVLSSDGSSLSPFRAVSVTKKAGRSNKAVTPVHFAAINPDPKYLRELLDVHPDTAVSDLEQWRIAHYAAACASEGALQVLIDRGADMLCVSKDKQTPLLVAASLGRVNNVKLLLSDLQHVPLMLKMKDKQSNTAMHLAAINGHTDVVEALIDAGAKETGCNNDHMTAMGAAASRGHLDVIKKMKEKGFSLAKTDRRQRTPLVLACREGQEHCVRYFLHHGVDANFPDSSGNSPAHYAAAYGWLHVLKVLVEEGGADADAVASWKATPLSCAALNHHAECVNYLIHRDNVNLNVVDGFGRTIIANLCRLPSYPALRQLEVLLAGGALIALADTDGMTALHHLCASHDTQPHDWRDEIVKKFGETLLANGADAEKCTSNGRSPLLCALEIKPPNLYAAQFLIAKGVSLAGTDGRGSNALHYVAREITTKDACGMLDAIKKHKDVSSLVNRYDSTGCTPLLLACKVLCDYSPSWWEGEDEKKAKITQMVGNLKKMISFAATDVSLPVRKTTVRLLSKPSEAAETVSDEEDMDGDNNSNGTSDDESSGGEQGTEMQMDDSDGSDVDETADAANSWEDSGTGTSSMDKVSFKLVEETQEQLFFNKVNSRIGFNAIHLAVMSPSRSEWVTILGCLLKKANVNLNLQGARGYAPIHLALEKSNEAAVNKLIKANADINIQDLEGRTTLHRMIPAMKTCESFATVMKASDLSIRDCRQRTCLHLAAMSGDVELCAQLLDAGCDLHAVDRLQRTALHYAVAQSARKSDASSDLEALLLKRGCDVNAADIFGRAPVHYAFLPAFFVEPEEKEKKKDDAAMLKEILELTEKAEDRFSEKYDPIETVYCLFSIGKGIESDPLDKKGCSPLHYAARVSALTCSLQLLSFGADINRKGGPCCDMPLRWALRYGNPEYGIMMLQKNAVTEVGDLASGKNASDLKMNVRSVFYLAVENGWLGVAYMIFNADFPLFDGLRDAMLTRKYILTTTLMKKVDDAKLLAVDDEQRSLVHWLCISAMPSCDTQHACSVLKVLVDAGCDVNAVDKYGRTALHYASQLGVTFLVKALIHDYGATVDVKDEDGKTALVLAVEGGHAHVGESKKKLKSSQSAVASLLERDFFSTPLPRRAPNWKEANSTASVLLKAGAVRDLSYHDLSYSDASTTLLCHAVRQGNLALFKNLLDDRSQANALCKTCDGNGMSALAHAIVLNEDQFARLLISHSDMSFCDKQGRTLVHLIVQPIKYGSYENVDLLKALAKAGAPLSADDCEKHTPMHYAKLQDSGVMAKALQQLGAEAEQPGLCRERTVWHKFPEKVFSIDDDCEAFISESAAKEKPKPLPDQCFEQHASSAVYSNDDGVWYDVLLNKVDISHGAFGYNNYYRMQVLHETVQNVYYLWTHWGRWGDGTGMFQRTPFNTAAEACTEFGKIFRSKSGNDFLKAAGGEFEAQPKKYSMMSVDCSHTIVSSLLAPFDLDSAPASSLPVTTQSTLKFLTTVTSLRDRAKVHGLSSDGVENVLMFGEASTDKLFQARSVLKELYPLAESISKLPYQPNYNVDEFLRMNDRMVKLSQKYYEIVPFAHTAFGGSGSSPMVIMSGTSMIVEAMERLDQLSDLAYTARLLLAAWHRRHTVSPLDYIMKSVEASLVPLHEGQMERNVIEAYMLTTGGSEVNKLSLSALYKVERRGEPERMEKFRSSPNHRLLWHGSPNVNILGILSQGLMLTRGNPSQRMMQQKAVDEESIWDGLYFADMFEKSFGYTNCLWRQSKENTRLYMLLCEVALGRMQTFSNAQNSLITRGVQLLNNMDSMFCPGERAPNWKNAIVLPNGVEIPLGEVAHPARSIEATVSSTQRNWPMAEYIVLDESRVRIRYILELQQKKKGE